MRIIDKIQKVKMEEDVCCPVCGGGNVEYVDLGSMIFEDVNEVMVRSCEDCGYRPIGFGKF